MYKIVTWFVDNDGPCHKNSANEYIVQPAVCDLTRACVGIASAVWILCCFCCLISTYQFCWKGFMIAYRAETGRSREWGNPPKARWFHRKIKETAPPLAPPLIKLATIKEVSSGETVSRPPSYRSSRPPSYHEQPPHDREGARGPPPYRPAGTLSSVPEEDRIDGTPFGLRFW